MRQLCLAQAHAPAKRSRAKSAAAAKAAPHPCPHTILERVPLRHAAHAVVWSALREHATRQTVIDSEHPGEAFPAYVVDISRLGGEAVSSITQVLAERRATALDAEKGTEGGDILAKRLDRTFEQEIEWMMIRNLLAAALRAGGKSGRRKPARALLLIDM